MPKLMRKGATAVGNLFLQVLGVGHIKLGAKFIRTQWDRLRRIDCPKCQSGRLYPFFDDGVEFLGCNQCDHCQSRSVDEMNVETTSRLKDFATEQLERMSHDDMLTIMRGHQKRSRLNYAFCFSLLFFDVYFLLSNSMQVAGAGFSYLTVLVISLIFFIKGLAYAYRYWQVKSKTLFVEGAFYRWLKLGYWLV